MKFSDYKDDKKKTREKSESGSGYGGNGRISEENKRMLSSLLRQYGGKNKQELMQAVIIQAEKSRKEGKLTDAELDAFVSLLYPSLDTKGKKELDEIVARIKKL